MSATEFMIRLSIVAAVSGCSGPIASGPELRPTSPSPPGARLRSQGAAVNGRHALYVTDLEGGCTRGRLVYVLDNKFLPYSKVRPTVGIAQCVDVRSLAATWYCSPERPFDEALQGEGLPVEPVMQDANLRVGRCFGHYLAGDPAAWKTDQDWVDVRLDLGKGDGVAVGDRYDVLGEPEVDETNRVVTDFKKIGECLIQDFEVSLGQATCRLDRTVWGGTFTQRQFMRPGFIRKSGAAP